MTGRQASSPHFSSALLQRAARWLGQPQALLLAALALSYAYFPPTAGWNENSRLDLTRALVEQGTVTIDSFHLNTADKARCGQHICSDKAPGASLLGTIPYALYHAYRQLVGAPAPASRVLYSNPRRARLQQLSKWDEIQVNRSFIIALFLVSLFVSALPGALSGLLLARLARQRLGQGQASALALGAIYGLATIAFPFSTSLFGHQLATFLLLASFSLADEATRAPPGRRRAALATAAGAVAGCGVLSEYPLAIPLLLLAGYLWLMAARREVAWYLAGALPPLLGLALYLQRSFGSPFKLGYGSLDNPTFAAGQSQGLFGVTYPRPGALWGMLFSRFRGLLYVSPVLGLAPLGWLRLWRQHQQARPVLLFAAVMVGYFLLLNTSYYMWWGGASAGPRHALPMLPFLCLPLLAARGEDRRWGLLCALLVAYSAFNCLTLAAAGPKAPEFGDLLWDYAWPIALGRDPQRLPQTLGTALGLAPALSVWLVPLLWGLVATVMVQQLRAAK